MKKTFKVLIVMLILLSAITAAFAAGENESASAGNDMPYKGQTLTVSWWGYNMDLLEKNLIKPFEEKYGVEVVTESGNNSDRFTKMVARKANPLIDVVYFAGSWAYKAKEEGIIQPYDPAKLTNLSAIMESAKDPLGGRYAIGYTIQHLGIFYRTDKVAPITSWKDLSRDDLKGFITIPGISSTYGPMLVYMLSKAWADDYNATDVGWQKIEELAPNLVTAYNRSSVLNTLVTQEEVYAAPYSSFAWGTILGTGLPVANVIPKEGLVGSYSMVSLAAGSKKEELAHLFMDYLLSYEVQLASAMDLVDSPARTDIVLPPEVAVNLTYGEELISQLHFFEHKAMADVQEEWIARWNNIFSE